MINIPKIFQSNALEKKTIILPILPLKDIVIFPNMVAPLFVGRTQSVDALVDVMNKDKTVFLTTQKKPDADQNKLDLSPVGTVATVMQLLRLPDGTVKALVEGKVRACVKRFIDDKSFMRVELEEYPPDSIERSSGEAHIRSIVANFKEFASKNKTIANDFIEKIVGINDPSVLSDTLSAALGFKLLDKQNLLETTPLEARLTLLNNLILQEIDILKVGIKIQNRVQKQMNKTQRNYYLHEQMAAIKKEMGAEEAIDEMEELEKTIKAKKMSEEASKKVDKEFKRLKLMPPISSEATIVRNYIDWILDLPWFDKSDIQEDLDKAEEILNKDHYGLEKTKERIVEYLAVQILAKKIKGPILCLVGPPGVGKTSIAKSVARATNRKFIRLSLGGVRDEAEIRGHRRTYLGALPGKIIQSLKKAELNNPVFCLDELDKMSTDFRGDPSSALLEVLDPEQNNSFNDHYLELDYDLSDILFITTANTLPDIPLPLQDRMEIIRIAGYTEYEKLQIAIRFLIPKQTEMNGLKLDDISFTKNAVLNIIQHYTREAGVRNLEREISKICRKIAKNIVKNRSKKDDEKDVEVSYKIATNSIQKYLGQHKFRHGQVELEDQIGIVTGLAWTQTGGELLCIETVIMPGKGALIITGKLGDVMQESAKAAVSYVRSRSESLNKLEKDFYKKYDIHIHVPEGAIPKDGPSAGVAMCTAIISALTKRPVYRDLAMTGEITLRGRILPIGGLKEKILAAHRGGIERILIPKENEKDLKDIQATILKQVKIFPVEHLDEVLVLALKLGKDDSFFIDNKKKTVKKKVL
ncbi:MAG: endopeptidase La [Desulfobacteraceae bacterium 4572_19]|nr:MAG: endopeptidase La [Desulfobacteraceae bacterium 4572_19]